MLHWPFDDPADATGDDEQKIEFFRRVREEIDAKIRSYLDALT
jgi:arsenate reductase